MKLWSLLHGFAKRPENMLKKAAIFFIAFSFIINCVALYAEDKDSLDNASNFYRDYGISLDSAVVSTLFLASVI